MPPKKTADKLTDSEKKKLNKQIKQKQIQNKRKKKVKKMMLEELKEVKWNP